MRILTAALLAALCLPAAAQQTKVLTAEKHNEYGLVYSLPKTALRIDVTATKQTRIAGPYFQYAKKYIGTDKIIRENSEQWSITSLDVAPYGVADNSTQYLMQLKSGSTTFIGVAEDGMLLSINRDPGDLDLPEVPAEGAENISSGEFPTGQEYLQYVDGDFLASQSKAKQAEMLAASLMEVRDAYVSLTRGTADNLPTDGRQLELMLNSLRKQEKALTEAFTGVSYEQTVSRSFSFTPGEEGRSVLFRLSDFAGFVGADDYSGEPAYITVKVTREGELPTDAEGNVKKYPKEGVAYCIPGAASIGITFQGTSLFSREFECGQYGVTFGLDPKLFTDKKAPSYAVFSPVTGGLQEIGTVNE